MELKMIPDLLYSNQIRRFIFEHTGQWIKESTINRWIKSEKIESFKLPNNRRVTRKCFVMDFIRRNVYE